MKRIRRRSIHSLALVVFMQFLFTPHASEAQNTPPTETTPEATPAAAPAASPDDQPRFFDSVTVSATLNPTRVKDTPGTVSVIDAETIERRMIENVADLVKFEPGVYVETNLTRVGLNGFNIRGIGGNRVMTQVDGVETSEQFDFGPFNVHQFALDLDTLKTAEIVRSSGSSLYGSDALGGVVSFFTKDPADYLRGPQPFHLGAKTLFDGRAQEGKREHRRGRRASAGAGIAVCELRQRTRAGQQGRRSSPRTATRTAPNPQDRRNIQALGKAVFTLGNGNVLRGRSRGRRHRRRDAGLHLARHDRHRADRDQRRRHHLRRHDAAPAVLGRPFARRIAEV